MINKYRQMENVLTTILTVAFAVVIGAVAIYAVFFPVATNLNNNSTASYTATNTSSYFVNGTQTNYTVATYDIPLTAASNVGGSLVVFYRNVTPAVTGAVSFQLNGVTYGVLPASAIASPSYTSFTFSNISSTDLTTLQGSNTMANLTFYNSTTNQNAYQIANVTLSYGYTNFQNIPASQQGNWQTTLLLAGTLVLIIVLVGIIYLSRLAG